MYIVCPHCTTSLAIKPGTLGAAGRNVRCSRCKEVWLARPQDAVEIAPAMPVMAEAGGNAEADAAAEWEALAREEEAQKHDTPVVDSPSISADWPADDEGANSGEADWPSIAQADAEAHEEALSTHRSRLASLAGLRAFARTAPARRKASIHTTVASFARPPPGSGSPNARFCS